MILLPWYGNGSCHGQTIAVHFSFPIPLLFTVFLATQLTSPSHTSRESLFGAVFRVPETVHQRFRLSS